MQILWIVLKGHPSPVLKASNTYFRMDGKRNSWQRSWKNIDSNRCSITYRPGIGEMESEASLVFQAERENFKKACDWRSSTLKP